MSDMLYLLLETREVLHEARRKAWWSDQPRSQNGQWTSGGGSGKKLGDLFIQGSTPTPQEAQNNIDDVMGKRGHGFKAEEDKDGNARFKHEDDPGEGVPIKGKSIFDTIIAMTDYVDTLSALTARAVGMMGKKFGKALSNLNEVLGNWSSSGG